MLAYRKQFKPPLGQHFLYDEKILNKIVDAAEVCRRDVVLEIGAGTGSLTQKLLLRARKVIAVELDKGLVAELKRKFKVYRNLEVIQKDILKIAHYPLRITDYKVVGNIPYYITGKIIRKFLQNKNRPQTMVLLVQKEVAERICAQAGKMSILAVAVQTFGQPEIVDYVGREKFSPPPEVDSAILRIKMFPRSQLAKHLEWFGRRGKPRLSPAEMEEQEQAFFRLIKIGFSSRRKQIHNNLKNGYHLTQEEVEKWLQMAGIKKTARAQELGIGDWIRLVQNSKFKVTA